jgi:hypothetical protein
MANLLKGKVAALRSGFEQLVYSSITNAWAVPVLLPDPKRFAETPLARRCGEIAASR